MNKVKTLIILLALIFIPFTSYANVQNQPNTQVIYDEETISFFTDIALGFEYGHAFKMIRKWNEDIRIKVTGDPTQEDLITLGMVMGELNGLIGDKIKLKLAQGNDYNVEIYFGKVSTFREQSSNYVDGNYGYFEVYYDGDNYIREAKILESTDMPTRLEKNHLLKEEISQILGLAQDSYKYPDSIFYGVYGDVQEYSEMDRKIIQMLYLDEVKVGMSKVELERVFLELNKKNNQ